ncbi:MAG: tetratricopeptide repeat protein [Patescibacteria group bacterium]
MVRKTVDSTWYAPQSLAGYFFLIGVVVAPIIVGPSLMVPLAVSKTFWFTLVAVLSASAILLDHITAGRLFWPRGLVLPAMGLATMLAAVASWWAPNFKQAWLGLSGETATLSFLASAFIFLVLAALILRHNNWLERFYFFTVLGIALGIVWSLLAIVFFNLGWAPAFLASRSVIGGGWFDLAALSGLGLIIGLSLWEFGMITVRWQKSLISGAVVLCLLALAILDQTRLWLPVGLTAVAIFVFRLGVLERRRPSSFRPAMVVVIFAIFLLSWGRPGGSLLGGQLAEWRGGVGVPSDLTMARSASQIWSMMLSGLDSNLWFGRGGWGLGTGGWAVVLAWCLVAMALAREVGRSLRQAWRNADSDELARAFVATLVTFDLWWINFFYSPGPVLRYLAFIWIGVLLAALSRVAGYRPYEWLAGKMWRRRLPFMAVNGLVLIVVWAGGYLAVERLVARHYSAQAATLAAAGQAEAAAEKIDRAISMDEQDYYHRQAIEIYLLRLEKLLAVAGPTPTDAQLDEVSNLANRLTLTTESALAINSQSARNWATRGVVFGRLATLGINGVAEQARAAYDRASQLEPTNPQWPYQAALGLLGQLDQPVVAAYLDRAISIDPNYIPARLLGVRLLEEAGNWPLAESEWRALTRLDPINFANWFGLGVSRYRQNNFTGALDALTQALVLNPDYANARYFLALVYDELGRDDEAIRELEVIAAANSDRADLQEMITRLRSGQSALVK